MYGENLPMTDMYQPEKMENMFSPGSSSNDNAKRKGFQSMRKRMLFHEAFIAINTIALVALAIIYFWNIPITSHQSGRAVVPEMQTMYDDALNKIEQLRSTLRKYEDAFGRMNQTFEDVIKKEEKIHEDLMKVDRTHAKDLDELYSKATVLQRNMSRNTEKCLSLNVETKARFQVLESTLETQTTNCSQQFDAVDRASKNLFKRIDDINLQLEYQTTHINQLNSSVQLLQETNQATDNMLSSIQDEVQTFIETANSNHSEFYRDVKANGNLISQVLLTVKNLSQSNEAGKGEINDVRARLNELDSYVNGNVSRHQDELKHRSDSNKELINRLSLIARKLTTRLNQKVTSFNASLENLRQETNHYVSMTLEKVSPEIENMRNQVQEMSHYISQNFSDIIEALEQKDLTNTNELQRITEALEEDFMTKTAAALMKRNVSEELNKIHEQISRNFSEYPLIFERINRLEIANASLEAQLESLLSLIEQNFSVQISKVNNHEMKVYQLQSSLEAVLSNLTDLKNANTSELLQECCITFDEQLFTLENDVKTNLTVMKKEYEDRTTFIEGSIEIMKENITNLADTLVDNYGEQDMNYGPPPGGEDES